MIEEENSITPVISEDAKGGGVYSIQPKVGSVHSIEPYIWIKKKQK